MIGILSFEKERKNYLAGIVRRRIGICKRKMRKK